jgi:O-methyltransferase
VTLARRIHSRLPSRVRSSPVLRLPASRLGARDAERDVARMIDAVRPLSMVHELALRDLVTKVDEVLDAGVPGDLVECGVWRGGSSLLMAQVLERRGERGRKVWMFDSFEGLPPPREVDGPAATAYAEDTESPRYFDNCRAELAEVESAARRMGLTERTVIVPGWFDDTLPPNRERVGPIALLRLDCDWHDPVELCLETLYDQVSYGGCVIVDDYYQWDGCAVAVHEFLGRRALAHRIQGYAGVAWFKKE